MIHVHGPVRAQADPGQSQHPLRSSCLASLVVHAVHVLLGRSVSLCYLLCCLVSSLSPRALFRSRRHPCTVALLPKIRRHIQSSVLTDKQHRLRSSSSSPPGPNVFYSPLASIPLSMLVC